MKKMFLFAVCLIGVAWISEAKTSIDHEEFVGPFPSWSDVKRDFGAVGDGKADDTAAIQKALDVYGRKIRVLYFPAGTYRLTKGLDLAGIGCGMIIGEDPAKTILKWDGADDGIMLMCNGVYRTKFARLTWNGGGKKGVSAVFHGWDGHSTGVGTSLEHSDEIFVDLALGIRAGKPHFMDAESSVLRCRFIRCTEAGVRIQSFNALDWFIWDSEFEDCAVGISNDPGAGHFHAYRNIFRRSTVSDIAMRNAGYFGIRHNLSLNSRRFFEGRDIGGWAVPMMIQGNTVIDSTDPISIFVGNPGPTLLIDNTIKSRDGVTNGPVMFLKAGVEGDYVAVGNTFTVTNPITARGRYIELQTRVAAAKSIVAPALTGAVTPENKKRKIFEVTSGTNSAGIQAAIQSAMKYKGKRPVIHFPGGTYGIDKTLTVPAGLDAQFVGDSGSECTILRWTGGTNAPGPIMALSGPARATFRDLQFEGGGLASIGLLVREADQPGARLYGDGLEVIGGVGLLADGLDQADLSFRSFYHMGCEISVKVVGGPLAAAGKPHPGRTVLFGGASSNNKYSYDVARGGRLMVQDTWYEGAPPTFLKMTGYGTFTMSGAMIAPGRAAPNAAPTDPSFAGVALENFNGTATFLSTVFGTRVVIAGEGKDASVMLMGVQPSDENMFVSPPSESRAALLQSRRYSRSEEGAPETRAVPNIGKPESDWILKMLAQLRTDLPRPLTTIPQGATDLRFYRMTVAGSLTNILVQAN
jgi:hypothetical protein